MGKSTIVGLSKMKADLARAAAKIQQAADDAVDEGAEAVAQGMRAGAPVDTGELVDGIAVRPAEDGVGKDVGVFDVGHAGFVEFGTEDTPAQPFAQPAAEAERRRLPKRVADRVNRSVG